MILIGRGLNHEAGFQEVKRKARSSVQVNSDCAVVKVRIKECRKERRTGRETEYERHKTVSGRKGNQVGQAR